MFYGIFTGMYSKNCSVNISLYSKIPLSRTWFISNTMLISKSDAGPDCFLYINDLKNSWYLEHGYLEYPAYLEVYLRSQTLILPRLSRSAVKFPVCLIFLASLRHQLTPAAIYTHYNYVLPETLAYSKLSMVC
jgi:hypothetical protein